MLQCDSTHEIRDPIPCVGFPLHYKNRGCTQSGGQQFNYFYTTPSFLSPYQLLYTYTYPFKVVTRSLELWFSSSLFLKNTRLIDSHRLYALIGAKDDRKSTLSEFLTCVGMTACENLLALTVKLIISDIKITTDRSLMNSVRIKLGMRAVLTDIEAEALIMFRYCTVREVQFWRTYRLSAYRDSILDSMPSMQELRSGQVNGQALDKSATTLTSIGRRNKTCERFLVKEALSKRFKEMKEECILPYPSAVAK